jgi:hypothetical protein
MLSPVSLGVAVQELFDCLSERRYFLSGYGVDNDTTQRELRHIPSSL